MASSCFYAMLPQNVRFRNICRSELSRHCLPSLRLLCVYMLYSSLDGIRMSDTLELVFSFQSDGIANTPVSIVSTFKLPNTYEDYYTF